MKRLSGDEHFSFAGKQEERKIVDFWSWHSSVLLADTTRAILAEYIVAMALDIDQNTTQNGWDDYDLDYNGTHLEIKSSSAGMEVRRTIENCFPHKSYKIDLLERQ